MFNTGQLTYPFRRLGLMHLLDKGKFFWQRYVHQRSNAAYQWAHPDIAFPPDYMLFEAFRLHYKKYWEGGQQSAREVCDALVPHLPAQGARVLDWGCGPARLVRHLPGMLPADSTVYGTDYNPATIEWCQQHIRNVHFSVNRLQPPTAYADGFFHGIYGISIFTHLSEAAHVAWCAELKRIAAPDGVLLLTTHGDAFRAKLTAAERRQYDRGTLVVRGRVQEGHRVYTAFHPPAFFQNLWGKGVSVLEHTAGRPQGWGIEQDTWLLQV